MLSLIGIKSRESFNGKSQQHVSWVFDTEKYGLKRTHWYVYQSLLLFYMGNPFSLLIPELVTVILRQSFWIAIQNRINEAQSYGWQMVRCSNTTINTRRVPDGLCIIRPRKRYENDETIPKTIHDFHLDENNAFTLTNIDNGDQLFIFDSFLNDDWMRDYSSKLFDEELYRRYLRNLVWDNMGLDTLYIIFCLIDASFCSSGLSRQCACMLLNTVVMVGRNEILDLFQSNSTVFISSIITLPDQPILRVLMVSIQMVVNPLYIIIIVLIPLMEHFFRIHSPVCDVLNILSTIFTDCIHFMYEFGLFSLNNACESLLIKLDIK